MANYGHVLLFSLIGGVFSLLGGLLLLSNKRSASQLSKYSTPFAAGTLLAAAFFDLLPEAIELTVKGSATRWVLGGILAFFLIEHFLRWFHHHHEDKEDAKHTTAPLVIIGDSIHNFIDGIAIGAAFLVNVPTGIIAAIAVAAHEIPQEIGDFGILLKFGIAKKKVLLVNIASALMSTIGALLTFWIGNRTSLPVGVLLAITAGMFIYIAASDLIPSIHQEPKNHARGVAAALLILGVLIVGVATEVAHEYIDNGHKREEMVCIEGSCESVVEDHHHEEESDHHEH